MIPNGQNSNGKPRPRTGARVAAVQALFQSEQGPTSPETVIDEFIRFRFGNAQGSEGFEDGRVHEVDVKLFANIVRAAVREQDRIDGLIAEHLAADWKIERLDPVLRALIRAGAAELAMKDGPPPRVVINEYLDVAHGFFEGDEPRMANGLLDKLAHLLRPTDFAGA
jgi:N utilization substance protein B